MSLRNEAIESFDDRVASRIRVGEWNAERIIEPEIRDHTRGDCCGRKIAAGKAADRHDNARNATDVRRVNNWIAVTREAKTFRVSEPQQGTDATAQLVVDCLAGDRRPRQVGLRLVGSIAQPLAAARELDRARNRPPGGGRARRSSHALSP